MVAILVALAVATTILPSVYAQTSLPPIYGTPSQQGTQHACPPGTASFSQGQCTVTAATTTAHQCPLGQSPRGTGQGTCAMYACPGGTFIGGVDNIARCQSLAHPSAAPFEHTCPPSTTLQGHECVGGTACPPGTTLQDISCVTTTTTTTRPGQGNQP
jgi:hypothetical protein